jgi:hypothetical protein
MTSSPRGRNAATAIAVVLTLVLAFAWLHSSDAGTLDVPAGLSVETVLPTAPEKPAEPEEPAELGQGEGRRRHADRAGGGEDPRARRKRRARPDGRVPIRPDPPATAPAPWVESGGGAGGTAGNGDAAGGTSGATSPAPQQAPPEFALG